MLIGELTDRVSMSAIGMFQQQSDFTADWEKPQAAR